MTLCQLYKQEQHWMAGWWNQRATVESSNVLWDINPAITWHDWEKLLNPDSGQLVTNWWFESTI